MTMGFERFTERAQEALARAQQILQERRHNQLDVDPCVITRARYRRKTIPVSTAISPSDSENLRITVGSSKCH